MKSCIFISMVMMAVIFVSCNPLKKQYLSDVSTGLKQSNIPDELIMESDLQHLPAAVKKYLHYTGVAGKKKVANFYVSFKGQIRKDQATEWMNFTSAQYNFLDSPTRLFYMKAVMKGMPVKGFHCYKDGKAFMDIRLFSLFKVQYQDGREMDTAETVTFFNDMCCMAPATLIDKRIRWEVLDSLTVRAFFTNKGITISALLYFNDKGELINFVSDHRYALMKDNTMRRLRWSTPLKDYKEVNGYRLAGYARAIYTYPEGDFCYGTFRLTDVQYNLKDVQ